MAHRLFCVTLWHYLTKTFYSAMANYNASDAVTLYPDGKYRWVYEMNLYTNPTILFLVLKIFFWICFGLWVFMSRGTLSTIGWT